MGRRQNLPNWLRVASAELHAVQRIKGWILVIFDHFPILKQYLLYFKQIFKKLPFFDFFFKFFEFFISAFGTFLQQLSFMFLSFVCHIRFPLNENYFLLPAFFLHHLFPELLYRRCGPPEKKQSNVRIKPYYYLLFFFGVYSTIQTIYCLHTSELIMLALPTRQDQ